MKVEKHSPRWLLEKILNNANHPAKALLYIIEFQNELVKNNCDLPVVIESVCLHNRPCNWDGKNGTCRNPEKCEWKKQTVL